MKKTFLLLYGAVFLFLGCGKKGAERASLSVGDACDVGSDCGEGLQCDSATEVCRQETECERLDCMEAQFCEADGLGTSVDCQQAQCEPGFVWSDEETRCLVVDSASCEVDAEDSIADACAALNRICEDMEGSGHARCGDCIERAVPEGSRCVIREEGVPEVCEELGCNAQNRNCVVVEEETACGNCSEGFVEEEGQCVRAENPAGCALLDCVPGTQCVENPEAVCESICEENFVWDNMIGGCREKITCQDLTCDEEQFCDAGSDNEDAKCVDNCDGEQGWDIGEERCRSCRGSGISCADLEGSTGRVILDQSADNANCICEPAEGYYPDSNNTLIPCDADGDGWVNAVAWRYFENGEMSQDQNAVFRALGERNCALRKVREVVLRNEAMQEKTIDLSAEGVGFYESSRNDRGIDFSYGQGTLSSRHLNSLTKACVSTVGDFNGNGVADVEEWSDSILGDDGVHSERYRLYAQLSYFVELHDGWFERLDNGGYKYVIEERSRLFGVPNAVPVTYLASSEDAFSEWYSDAFFEEVEDGNEYWRVCERKMDALYSEDHEFAVTSRAGADLTKLDFPADEEGGNEAAEEPWRGMNHHSQFKCVQVIENEGTYDMTFSLTESPQAVFLRNRQAELFRKEAAEGGQVESLRWNINTCSADEGELREVVVAQGEVLGINPAFPTISCEADLDNQVPAGVYWAAVGFQNYADVWKNDEDREISPYQRGCINECIEWGVAECPVPCVFEENGWPVEAPRFTCDASGQYRFGKLVCGCNFNFGGGAACDIGCPDQELRYNGDFNIETRQGTWMCAKPAGSLGTTMELTIELDRYTLRGHIPQSGTNGVRLQSADGEFVVRAR